MANYVRSESLGEPYGEDRSEMTPTRRKHIHKHRKWADTYGPKLPYDFGIFKPKLGKHTREFIIECECGHHMYVSKITKAIICSRCNTLCNVEIGDE